VITAVGYTNAGKSTLFNLLTEADVLVEDRLFATLDSTVRRLSLPGGRDAVMSDTVGFVRRLPHELVEAFRSTLEEVTESDLLLHVVDCADADPDRQIDAVRAVLGEIGASELPELMVLNKTDTADPVTVARLQTLHPAAVPVSALTGDGVERLLDEVAAALQAELTEIEVLIPYEDGAALALAHRVGEVVSQENAEGGTALKLRLRRDDVYLLADWLAGEDPART
jgi:GTP-binding protein HflX